MTRTGSLLADGFLPTSKTAIYTAPASTVVYISEIVLFNTNATPQTIIIYVNPGTSRIDARFAGMSQYFRMRRGAGIILESGDTIEAETTTGTAVSYAIYGVKETSP